MKLKNKIWVLIIVILLAINVVQYGLNKMRQEASQQELETSQQELYQQGLDSYNRAYEHASTIIYGQKSIYEGYIFYISKLNASDYDLEELEGFTAGVTLYDLRAHYGVLSNTSAVSEEIFPLIDRFYSVDKLFQNKLERIPYSDLLELSDAFTQMLPLLNNDSSETDSLYELLGKDLSDDPAYNDIISQVNAQLDVMESILQRQETA